MTLFALAAVAGMSVGPIGLSEGYKEVTSAIGKGTTSRRCYGRTNYGDCAGVLEYAIGDHLLSITFFRDDGVERVGDILIERHLPASDLRLAKAKSIGQRIRWTWEGIDVLNAVAPRAIHGWIPKSAGEFVKADDPGVAAVFLTPNRGFRLVLI